MKKGFLHMAEVIIVSVLVFTILSQFYNIPKSNIEWSNTKLGVTAHDLIYVMEEKGVDWFDFTEVNHTLYNADTNIARKLSPIAPLLIKITSTSLQADNKLPTIYNKLSG